MQSWKAQLGIICGQEANHYKSLVGSGIWRHTSDHLPPCNNEGTSLEKECSGSSTSCWNISSLDCRFGWERLSFSAGTLSARQAMCYEVPVLATLCGWGSILCLKYLAKSTQVLVQCWKAQLGIICGQKANHSKLQFGSGIWRHTRDHLPPWRKNEGTGLTGKRIQ